MIMSRYIIIMLTFKYQAILVYGNGVIICRGVNLRRVRSRNFVGLLFSLRTVRTVKILSPNFRKFS